MRVRLPKSAAVRRAERRRKDVEWHDHFALWPVRIKGTEGAWLETVYRRRMVSTGKYEYMRKSTNNR